MMWHKKKEVGYNLKGRKKKHMATNLNPREKPDHIPNETIEGNCNTPLLYVWDPISSERRTISTTLWQVR